MPRHRITTASLLDDIERRRAAEASSRWQELSRQYMREDAPADRPETRPTLKSR
jgi:hypothetical protein